VKTCFENMDLFGESMNLKINFVKNMKKIGRWEC
jgi:hypothetical protein